MNYSNVKFVLSGSRMADFDDRTLTHYVTKAFSLLWASTLQREDRQRSQRQSPVLEP